MSTTDKQTNMTPEEAIKVLQEEGCVDCIHETEGYAKCEFEGNCKVRTAMNMAIEALKAQNERMSDEETALFKKELAEAQHSDDAISRERGERMKNYDVLDELVPKTQELHRAIFDKGYEQGLKDGFNSEYNHDHAILKAYSDGQAYIIDMLKEEIGQIHVIRDIYSQRQNDYCDGREFTLKQILEIIGNIGKYVESEE